VTRSANLVFFVILATTVHGQSLLELELERAWLHDPLATMSALTDREAELTLEAARRSWWPVAALASPSLLSASGGLQASNLAGNLTASVAQKLPGGGALTAGATQSVSKALLRSGNDPTELIYFTEFTLIFTQPLARATDMKGEDERLVARLKHELILRDLFTETVRRAGILDSARTLVTARRAALKAAVLQKEVTVTWETQGRGTLTETWKAQRAVDAAQWSLEKALLDVEEQEKEWQRRSGSALGTWTKDDVLALETTLDSTRNGDDLEKQIAEVEARLAAEYARLDQIKWAPQLAASASSKKDSGQPWQFSARVGFEWTTDAFIQAPVARQKADVIQNRQAQTAQQEASARQLQSEQQLVRAERLAERLNLLTREVERQDQLLAETRRLVTEHRLPEIDLAVAEADAALLAFEQRTMFWEKLVLKTKTAKE